MSKFKVGATHTKDGSKARILEIGYRIFGRIKVGGTWFAHGWDLDGKSSAGPFTEFELLPNNPPVKEEFEEVVKRADLHCLVGVYTRNVVIVPDQFAGKCVRVTIEEIEG